MSSPDPWAVRQGKYPREEAIARGLKSLGYPVDDRDDPNYWGAWPVWAAAVYFACDKYVDVIRRLAEGPAETREAVETAYALGGAQAVFALLATGDTKVTSETWFEITEVYARRVSEALGRAQAEGVPAWVTYIEHSVEPNAELLVTREPNVREVLRRIQVVVDAGLPDLLEAAYTFGGVLAIAPLMPPEIPRPKFGAFVDPNWGRK